MHMYVCTYIIIMHVHTIYDKTFNKIFSVRTEMNAHGKTFVVAAPFDDECLFLVN